LADWRLTLTAIKTERLTKTYGQVVALNALDLEVEDNTVFGFLGPNGAGKTTTVRLLTGFSRPTSGRAWVAGEKLDGDNLALRSKTGLLPDVPAFYPWMTGMEFLLFVGELHRLGPTENRKRAEKLLDIVGLEKAAKRRVGGYSRGMRQRLGIAQALINSPKVLFMDEPTSALDPIGRREMLTLVQRLGETATIFMSTHILTDVERVCKRVGIIDKGRLVTVSTVEALQKKYAHSSFEIEFIEDSSLFAQTLGKLPWLTDVRLTAENGTQRISVRAIEIEHARRELPHMIANSGLTLSRYELVLPNLEDVFVEIVKGETTR
jgi:ABC-2 type transport system ATP-binding protein